MSKLEFGDIVLLNFPFTNGQKSKKRPAIILNDFEDGDIIVARITSQFYDTKFDFAIVKWEKAGLKLPSVIRLHKIVTLDKEMVEIVMGKIEDVLKQEIESKLVELVK
ncbi:MAG: type II toxin-antitoxin system PemK/MazF family toxin [Sphingobacteriales bacterium]|nr:MAG: type II toxin-antitoxin system PemK/MazF family toxin [Sphingobacteriales bacterium]